MKVDNMAQNNESNNPWTKEDEREHPFSVIEWWCLISPIKTNEDNKDWWIKIAFSEWNKDKNEIGSIINFDLLDQKNKKHYIYYVRSDSFRLKSEENRFYVAFEDSFFEGQYPNYKIYINDKKNNIKLSTKFTAEALPRWIAQDITSGQLPMGLGYYRYGFIPKVKVSGKLIFNEKELNFAGRGYYEHAWGDMWFDNPLSGFSGLKKTVNIYLKLIRWWFRNNKISIPRSIKFSTENNPFGYDWAWSLLDNGWSLYYGNIMFWIMEGPSTGTLILTKDGKKYEEFANIQFRYINIKQSKTHDFFYPTELEINAKKGNKKLYLHFKMTDETREYFSRFSGGNYWIGFIINESPGVVNGYYYDGKEKIKLSGISKIEPQRQIAFEGHNSLKIDILKPPEGVGISFELDSHLIKKKMFAKIQLAPIPKIKLYMKRIDESIIKR